MSHNEKLVPSKSGRLRLLAFGDSLTEGYVDWGTTWQPYGKALNARLSALLPNYEVEVMVKGKSGDCVCPSLGGEFLERLQAALPRSASKLARQTGNPRPNTPAEQPTGYDVVIILGGTNDLAYKNKSEDGPQIIFEALKDCYNRVIASGSSLLCLSVPERRADTETSFGAQRIKNARCTLNGLIAQYVANSISSGSVDRSVFYMDLAKAVPFDYASGDKEGLWSMDGLHMTAKGYDYVGQILAEYIHDILAPPTKGEYAD